MEEIYMKGCPGRREWCSDEVNVKSYFEKYSDALFGFPNKRPSAIDILQHYVPQSNQLSEEELGTLIDITSDQHFTNLLDNDLVKKALKKKIHTKYASGDEDDIDIPKPVNPCNKAKKNRIKNKPNRKLRRDVLLDAAEKCGKKDLIPKKDFIVSIRVHEPFNHRIGENSRPGRCMQQINVLGYQPLSYLRDKLICEMDFLDTRGDASNDPDSPVTERARDVYPSGMFYFNNSFYVDGRNKNNCDYSKIIKEWGDSRGIILGETFSMEKTLIKDLDIRFGYPYLYMHQGCCEHLLVINEARLLTSKDSLYSSDYPLMVKVSYENLIYCMTCTHVAARWIVRESDRVVHDPSYLCKSCLKLFHYKHGKKIGNFKAYQFWQRTTIL